METMGLQPQAIAEMTWSYRQRTFDEKYKLEKQRSKKQGGLSGPRRTLGRRH